MKKKNYNLRARTDRYIIMTLLNVILKFHISTLIPYLRNLVTLCKFQPLYPNQEIYEPLMILKNIY